MPDGCALVTGASRGIGAAIARSLAQAGWPVGVNYSRDASGAESVVAEIGEAGGRAVAVQADVTEPDAPQRLWAAMEQEFDRPVLALVNNAGVNRDDLVPTLGDEEWREVIDTNLSAAFRLIRHALRPMLRARQGRIVNLSSVVARRGITINAVAPGWIDTQMTSQVPTELLSAVPARRAGTPEEVAACVRFLVSEEASYVTGAVLTVDGGLAA